MKKSYHEHCQEERIEALKALTDVQAKEQGQNMDKVVIRYSVAKIKDVVMSVPRRKLKQIIDKIRMRGYEIKTVDGKLFEK